MVPMPLRLVSGLFTASFLLMGDFALRVPVLHYGYLGRTTFHPGIDKQVQ
jgi:hypothetical protein